MKSTASKLHSPVFACKVPGGYLSMIDGEYCQTKVAALAVLFPSLEEAHAALKSFLDLSSPRHWGTAWTFQTTTARMCRV